MFCFCKLLIPATKALLLLPYLLLEIHTRAESALCLCSVVVLLVSNSDLGLEHAHFFERDVSALEVVVVLERDPSGGEVVVRGTVRLFEAREFLSHAHLALHHSSEIPSREEAVVGNGMVHRVGLVVVQMLEVARIRVTEVEGKEGISVIDTV